MGLKLLLYEGLRIYESTVVAVESAVDSRQDYVQHIGYLYTYQKNSPQYAIRIILQQLYRSIVIKSIVTCN